MKHNICQVLFHLSFREAEGQARDKITHRWRIHRYVSTDGTHRKGEEVLVAPVNCAPSVHVTIGVTGIANWKAGPAKREKYLAPPHGQSAAQNIIDCLLMQEHHG